MRRQASWRDISFAAHERPLRYRRGFSIHHKNMLITADLESTALRNTAEYTVKRRKCKRARIKASMWFLVNQVLSDDSFADPTPADAG